MVVVWAPGLQPRMQQAKQNARHALLASQPVVDLRESDLGKAK